MTLLRLALKSIRAHPARLILTGLAVVAGVAFVAGSFIISDSLKDTFGTLVADANSGVDARVQPEDTDFGEPPVISDTLPAQLQALDEVELADGFIEPRPEDSFNPFVALDAEGNEVVPQGPPVLSFSWPENDASIIDGSGGGFTLVDGRAPEGPGEMALLDSYAEALEAQVGDVIQVVTLNDGIQEFELAGTVAFPASGGAWFILFDFSTAQELYNRPGEVSSIELRSTPGTATEDLIAAAQAELPDGVEVIDAQEAMAQDSAEFEGIINIFRNILLAFAIVALFVSLFIIYNTFRILVSQRVREFGVLRAIGATSGQLIASVVVEAFLLGVVSGLLGLGLGIMVAEGIMGALRATGGFPETDTIVSINTTIIAFAVGIGATVFASILPATAARRISPVEAMRNEGIAPGSRRPRIIGGAIATGLGLVLVAWGLFGGGTTTGVLTRLGIGAVLTFVGVALLSELFGGPVVSVLGSRTGRRAISVFLIMGGIGLIALGGQSVADGSVLGAGTILLGLLGAAAGVFLASNAFSKSQLAGNLARQNAARNPERTASTATALMIGLALVTTVSVMGESLKTTFVDALSTSVTADLFVFSDAGRVSTGLADDLASVDGVNEVGAYSSFPVQVVADDEVVEVSAYDTSLGESLLRLGLTPDATEISDGEGIWVFEDTATDLGWAEGDTVEIRFEDFETASFEVSGLFDDDSIVTDVILDSSIAEQHYDDIKYDYIVVGVDEGADLEVVKTEARTVAESYSEVTVQDSGEVAASAESQIDGLLTVVNALLGFTLVIALIGIVNTIALSVAERTREIGLLRAVGMTRTQLARSIRWEAVIVAVFGALLGIALGVLFAFAAIQAIPNGIINTVSIPWVTLGSVIMLAAILGVLAAIIPGWSAGRKNVLAAIASD